MRRVLCVWLPMWPIDRLRRALRTQGSSAAPPQAEPRPFALVETGAHGLEIAAANACARAGGVQPGMAHADARALSPNLASRPIDRDADVKALTALALWCRRYTPWTQTDGCDGLKLDITGCAHLFGGEEALMRDLSMRLTRLGCQHALGLADTRAAARALARFASSAELSTRINPPGETRATLAPLPAVGLDLDADTLRLLRRLGLRTIGQLLDLSRTGLGRRFQSADAAKAVLTRLDEMFAERGDPFSPLAPPPVRHVRLACAESLETLDAVRVGLERLAPQLCAFLGNAGEGVRRAAFQICRVDGSAARICVGAARPTRDPSHLLRLLAEKLERLDPGFGVDLLILDAEAVERIEAGAQSLQDLADGAFDDAEALRFADRLAARFGSRSVRRLSPRDSWTPERA